MLHFFNLLTHWSTHLFLGLEHLKFSTRDFWGRWLRIQAQNSEIQNVGSNMGD